MKRGREGRRRRRRANLTLNPPFYPLGELTMLSSTQSLTETFKSQTWFSKRIKDKLNLFLNAVERRTREKGKEAKKAEIREEEKREEKKKTRRSDYDWALLLAKATHSMVKKVKTSSCFKWTLLLCFEAGSWSYMTTLWLKELSRRWLNRTQLSDVNIALMQFVLKCANPTRQTQQVPVAKCL